MPLWDSRSRAVAGRARRKDFALKTPVEMFKNKGDAEGNN